MRICELPGYDISGYTEDIDKVYMREIRQIVKKRKMATVLKLLKKHILRWKAFWELGQDRAKFPEILRKIARLDIHRTDIRRLYRLANDKKVKPKPSDKVATYLLLPPSMILARILANSFQVPFCTALHQGFCKDPNHVGCF